MMGFMITYGVLDGCSLFMVSNSGMFVYPLRETIKTGLQRRQFNAQPTEPLGSTFNTLDNELERASMWAQKTGQNSRFSTSNPWHRFMSLTSRRVKFYRPKIYSEVDAGGKIHVRICTV